MSSQLLVLVFHSFRMMKERLPPYAETHLCYLFKNNLHQVHVQVVYKLYFWTSPFHQFQSLVTITDMILWYSGSPFSTVHFCEFTFSYLVHYWSSFSQWALLHLNCVSTSIIVPRASFLGHFLGIMVGYFTGCSVVQWMTNYCTALGFLLSL